MKPASLDITNEEGLTALGILAKTDQVKVLEAAFSTGLNMNQLQNGYNTLLHVASKNRSY